MTKADIDAIILEKRLRLRFWDVLTHYGIVIFLAILPVMSIWFIIQELTGHGKGIRTASDFLIIGLMGLALGTLAYIMQRKRLQFRIVQTDLTVREIEEAISKTAEELGWKVVEVGSSHAVANRKGGFRTGSWGERIVIVFENDQILINSICDPDRPSSITSFGQNRKNIRTLEKNIKSKQKYNNTHV